MIRWFAILCTMSRNRVIGPVFFDHTFSSECYCEAIPYPFIGHLSEHEIACVCFQQNGAATHSSCLHGATTPCVWGQNNLKGYKPPWSLDLTPPDWLLSGGSNERCSSQGQFSHYPWTEGSHCEFQQDILPIKLSCVVATKIRRVNDCLQAGGSHFTTFVVT